MAKYDKVYWEKILPAGTPGYIRLRRRLGAAMPPASTTASILTYI